ncbi:hypothetical protein HDU96_004204 [Phlyctochytrium bullatum]|nr:hypothetical protein HDU96_004204 [Phlyctochytrium bullatum]
MRPLHILLALALAAVTTTTTTIHALPVDAELTEPLAIGRPMPPLAALGRRQEDRGGWITRPHRERRQDVEPTNRERTTIPPLRRRREDGFARPVRERREVEEVKHRDRHPVPPLK